MRTILAVVLATMCCCVNAQDASPQARMRACNEQAGALSGDERKAFMMDCLRKSTPVTKPTVNSSASRDPGQDPVHRRGICGEIKKLDLLLYEDPSHHAPTTTCSYTVARLLVTPKTLLPPERMRRFVLLAFATVGKLYNDDFGLPDEVYAGFGAECQLMTTYKAALLQRDLRGGGDSGAMRALQMAADAQRVPCPK